MTLRERCKEIAAEQFFLSGEYGAQAKAIDAIEAFAREIRNEALEEALAIVRETPEYDSQGPRYAKYPLAHIEMSIAKMIDAEQTSEE